MVKLVLQWGRVGPEGKNQGTITKEGKMYTILDNQAQCPLQNARNDFPAMQLAT